MEELVKKLRYESTWRDDYPEDKDMLLQAADAIEQLEAAVPKWIPVTERLPNENDDVLIYGEWTGASGTKYREIWLTDLKGFLHQGYKPIAWMPPPEPPKEEPQIISAVDCNDCRYYPPSSLNGKPCTQCDMGNPLMNCFSPKEETE